MEPIRSVILTKSFLAELDTGLYLVSNTYVGENTPNFAEYVVAQEKRPEQWEKIKAAKAEQRICHVYRRKEDYERQSKGIREFLHPASFK